MAASPDGAFCAAGGASGAAFVWETSSGRLLRTWPAHYKVGGVGGTAVVPEPRRRGACNTCLAFSDGQTHRFESVFVALPASLTHLSPAPVAAPLLLAVQAITCLAWSDSGAVLVTGGEDTLVNAWLLAEVVDATAGQKLQVGTAGIAGCWAWGDVRAVGPAYGERGYCLDSPACLSCAGSSPVTELPLPTLPTRARAQMGGPLLQPLHSWSDHTLRVTCVAVGAGDAGALVASGSLDRTLKLRSLVSPPAGGAGGTAAGGPLLRSVTLPAGVHSLALDPGEHALYAGCASGTIYEVPLVGGGAAAAAGGGGGGAGLGAAAAAAADGGGSGALYAAMEGHSRAVSCLALTPDAAHLVSGSVDGSVRVWELRSRQPVRVLQNPAKGSVSALLVLRQPPHLQIGGSHAASASGGSSQGGKRGPKRPQPLAPFSKYPGAQGALKPWEGGLVLLDGSAGAAAAAPDWPAALLAEPAARGGAAASAALLPAAAGAAGAAASGAAAAGTAAGGDAAALQEENEWLRGQLASALATAEQWGRLNTQLQQLCAERLLGAGGAAGGQ